MESKSKGNAMRDSNSGSRGVGRVGARALGRRATARRGAAVDNAILPLEKRMLFSAFTPGDLVVYRVGTGGTLTSGASVAAFLDQYTPTGTVQTSPVSSVSLSGGSVPFSADGTGGNAKNEGLLSLSENGQTLLVTGYDAAASVSNIEYTQSSTTGLTGYVNSITIGATTSTPLNVSTGSTAGMVTGDQVNISGIGSPQSADGNFYVKVNSATNFTLYNDSALTQPYSGYGYVSSIPNVAVWTDSSYTGTNTAVPREVLTVNSAGNTVTSTTLGTSFDGSNIYGAASVDGTSTIYVNGQEGIESFTPGANGNASLITSDYAYGIAIGGNQLYATMANPSLVVSTVGSGLPASGTVSELPGIAFSGTSDVGVGYSRAMAFAYLKGGSTPDTIYVADAYNDGVDKLALVNGSWTLVGEIAGFGGSNKLSGITGVVAEPVPGGEQLFVSTSSNVFTITDPFGFDSNGGSVGTASGGVFSLSPTGFTTVANASTGTQFRGIAFAPQSSLNVATQPTALTNSSSGTSITLFSAANPGTNETVQWQVLPAGSSTWTSLTNITDANGEVISGATTNTLSLANLSLAETGNQYRAVFTSGSLSTSSNAATVNVTNNPAVLSLTPNGGVPPGGTSVTITGTNFNSSDTVYFGGVAASVVYNSPTSLTATAPANTSSGMTFVSTNVVNVTVNASTGVVSAVTTSDQYTYVALASVTSMSYSSASTISGTFGGIDSGGDQFNISGTNLSTVTGVSFYNASTGNVAALSFTYNSSKGVLVVVSPKDAAGTVADVILTNQAGASTATPADQFTYTQTTIIGTQQSYLVGIGGNPAIVTLDDNPVISQVLGNAGDTVTNGSATLATYTYEAFYIQDSTGSEEVFGNQQVNGLNSLPNNFAPQSPILDGNSGSNIGDAISITASVSNYQGSVELKNVTAIAYTSTTPVPVTFPTATIPQLKAYPFAQSIEGTVVTLKGVYIGPLSNGITTWGNAFATANQATGTVTDTAGNSMVLYYTTTYDEIALYNLYGQSIPMNNLVDMTGFVVYTNSTAEFTPLSVTNPSTVVPIVSSVSPAAGPVGGTNTVTISGFGFTDPAGTPTVYFNTSSGNVAGTNVNVVNDKTITVTAPAGSLGVDNILVANENGTSAINVGDQYTYTAAASVYTVSPGGGFNTGGTAVTITGSNFTGATAVKFGSVSVPITSANISGGGTIITVTSPAEPVGDVQVTVLNNGVPSSFTPGDYYSFDIVPTGLSISPSSGPDAGGTKVVISGAGLNGVTNVSFGSVAATSFSYNAANGTITAFAPAEPLGPEYIYVTNYAGTSAAATGDKYTYVAFNVANAENVSSGVSVTVDSNPVITEILLEPGNVNGINNPSTWAFLVQDSSGSMEVYTSTTALARYNFTPVVGNTIKVSGVWSPYDQIPEIASLTAISNTGTAALPALPAPLTVSQVNGLTLPLGTGYGGHLVTIDNATIGGLTGSFGAASQTGTLNDSSGSMTLYYYPTSYTPANEQFYGMAVPTGPVDLIGFIQIYPGSQTAPVTPAAAEFLPLEILPLPAWLATGSDAIWAPQAGTLYVNGPSTIIADPGTDNPTISTTNGGAKLNIAYPTSGNKVHISGISLNGGATVNVNTSTGTPIAVVDSNTGGLSIDSTSTFNLNNNFLDLTASSTTYATVNTLLTKGFNAGTWSGAGGITSSVAANSPLTTLGVIVDDNGANLPLYGTSGTIASSFDGTTPADGDVLVSYTYYGDANVDGKVDGTDYGIIDASYVSEHFVNGAPTSMVSGWSSGDFNYDGVVDGSDYTLIDNAYNMQGAAFPSAQLASPAAMIADSVSTRSRTGTAVSSLPVTNTAVATSFSNKKVKTSLIDLVLGDLVTSK